MNCNEEEKRPLGKNDRLKRVKNKKKGTKQKVIYRKNLSNLCQ
jgi:hypothetical protein